jgi:hypothetical protein
MKMTLAELINNPSFQVKQAKYENARSAVAAAYSFATKMAPFENWEDFFKAVDILRARYEADLNSTTQILEESHVDQTKPAEVPRLT